jgi:hypothetical protein
MWRETAGFAGRKHDFGGEAGWRGELGTVLRTAALRGWPYLILLVLSLIGICWANLAHDHSTLYWGLMTPVCALVCIIEAWRNSAEHHTRIRLVVLQAAQWVGVMVAMYLVGVSDLRDLLDDDALGLMMLTLLALGLFISGLNLVIWQFCVLGMFLAVAVPVIAWVEAASVLLVLLAAIIVLAALAWLWYRVRQEA